MNSLQPYIREYINRLDEIRDYEDYKWKALVQFKKCFHLQMLSYDVIKDSFAEHGNLLAAGHYFPLGMLKKVVKYRPLELKQMFMRLFDESKGLPERIVEYIEGFDALIKSLADNEVSEWKNKKKQSFQDTHSISVYLFSRYPEKYFIYKSSLFDAFAKATGYHIINKDKIGKIIEYEGLCEVVKSELIKEGELIEEYKKWMNRKGFFDPNLNLLTQDFMYAVAYYINVVHEDWDVPTDFIEVKGKAVSHKESVSFTGVKGIDYEKKDKLCRNLGKKGENYVKVFEEKRLEKIGITYEVEHTSCVVGDGEGYDIKSVEDDGVTERYIEVKTTTGPLGRPFFFSQNELDFSEQNAAHYYLYRVYEYDDETGEGKVGIIKGSLKCLNGTPTQYSAAVEKK